MSTRTQPTAAAMRAARTPGPWKLHPDNPTIVVANNRWIADCTRQRDGDEANAHLIAAAPQLIEALEGMLSRFGHLDTDPGKREACDEARAALKQAKGE